MAHDQQRLDALRLQLAELHDRWGHMRDNAKELEAAEKDLTVRAGFNQQAYAYNNCRRDLAMLLASVRNDDKP